MNTPSNQRIKLPLVWAELTQHAYMNYAKEYNASVNYESSKRLKKHHHQLFFKIVKDYAQKMSRLVSQFRFNDESPVTNKHVHELPWLEFNNSVMAAYYEIDVKTITAYIDRLVDAKVLTKFFYGDKRPVSLVIKADLLKVIDLAEENFNSISPKFVTDWTIEPPTGIRKNVPHIKDITRTCINIKTKNEGVHFVSQPETVTPEQAKVVKIVFTSNNDELNTFVKASLQEHFLTGTARQADTTENVIELDTLLLEASRQERTPGGAAPAGDYETAQKLAAKTQNVDLQSFLQNRLLTRDQRLLINRYHYANQFLNLLISKLFADKSHMLTNAYMDKTRKYIFEKYFGKRGEEAITQAYLQKIMSQYAYRIETAADYISGMKNFDKSLLFPLSYLNVNKTDASNFSFVNTRKFWDKKVEWERKTTETKQAKAIKGFINAGEEIQAKFHAICRRFENGRLSFDQAKQSVMHLNQNDRSLGAMFESRYRAVGVL